MNIGSRIHMRACEEQESHARTLAMVEDGAKTNAHYMPGYLMVEGWNSLSSSTLEFRPATGAFDLPIAC